QEDPQQERQRATEGSTPQRPHGIIPQSNILLASGASCHSCSQVDVWCVWMTFSATPSAIGYWAPATPANSSRAVTAHACSARPMAATARVSRTRIAPLLRHPASRVLIADGRQVNRHAGSVD